MRFPLLSLAILLCINTAVDVYIYKVLKRRCANPLWARLQAWSAVALFVCLVVFLWLSIIRTETSISIVFKGLYAYLSIYIVKYLFVVFDALSLLPKLWHRRRVKALSFIGLGLGFLIAGTMWWGAIFGRYNLRVNQLPIPVENLPAAFEGYRIAQISDLHVGSYGTDTAFVSKIVDRINSLNPDAIMFTGDIVNMNTQELVPFVSVLSRLKARDGVYSVLGNHDYGDYSIWPSQQTKDADHQMLLDLQQKMGWKMLNNAHAVIHNGSDSIMVIGVENIGDPPFHSYGDMRKAYPTPEDANTKILLTHNPSHWKEQIADNDSMNIALTLSGHTHAMQMKFFGYSPSSWRYDTWGGLYHDSKGRHPLYVNIGAGTVGIPARIGANPEITVFTLTNPHK